MAHIFAYCFTPWHIYFLIMHSISLKKPNFYSWAPTCHTLRTWRSNGSLSQSSLFSLSSFPLASLPSLLALLINSLSSWDKHFMFHSVSLLSQAPLASGSRALPSVLFENSIQLLALYCIVLLVVEGWLKLTKKSAHTNYLISQSCNRYKNGSFTYFKCFDSTNSSFNINP